MSVKTNMRARSASPNFAHPTSEWATRQLSSNSRPESRASLGADLNTSVAAEIVNVTGKTIKLLDVTRPPQCPSFRSASSKYKSTFAISRTKSIPMLNTSETIFPNGKVAITTRTNTKEVRSKLPGIQKLNEKCGMPSTPISSVHSCNNKFNTPTRITSTSRSSTSATSETDELSTKLVRIRRNVKEVTPSCKRSIPRSSCSSVLLMSNRGSAEKKENVATTVKVKNIDIPIAFHPNPLYRLMTNDELREEIARKQKVMDEKRILAEMNENAVGHLKRELTNEMRLHVRESDVCAIKERGRYRHLENKRRLERIMRANPESAKAIGDFGG